MNSKRNSISNIKISFQKFEDLFMMSLWLFIWLEVSRNTYIMLLWRTLEMNWGTPRAYQCYVLSSTRAGASNAVKYITLRHIAIQKNPRLLLSILCRSRFTKKHSRTISFWTKIYLISGINYYQIMFDRAQNIYKLSYCVQKKF